MQGVGKATKFNKRITNYSIRIEKKTEACCASKHYSQTGEHSLEDFPIKGIVKLENPLGNSKALDLHLRQF